MDNWHLKLFSRSVLKRAKWRQIRRMLPDLSDKQCLDLGADNGVISYMLRQQGGNWTSADLSMDTVNSIESLVMTTVVHIDNPPHLPFPDNAFDVIVIVDMLEHVIDDKIFADEITRILKLNGTLIINVPRNVRWSLVRLLQYAMGLTDEKHGHVRPGYIERELTELFSRFNIIEFRTYSRFFSELIDSIISFGMATLKSSPPKRSGERGPRDIDPGSSLCSGRDDINVTSSKGNVITASDMQKYKKLFLIYSITYPLVWLIAQFDRLIFFLRGHKLIVKFKLAPSC